MFVIGCTNQRNSDVTYMRALMEFKVGRVFYVTLRMFDPTWKYWSLVKINVVVLMLVVSKKLAHRIQVVSCP